MEIMQINRTCLPENYTYDFFLHLLRSYPKAFFVAEDKGKIVGYSMCRVERTVSRFEKLRIIKGGHVISVAVIPEYRRRQIALKLMVNTMKVLREEYGCTETFLEVRVSNEPATRLYAKLGYRILEIQKSYYADGEDAHLMARKLK